jgi:23S rRNA pseudouridine955/2504/2580 synthase
MTEYNQVRIVDVTSKSDGQRIDNFLLRELKGVPKSRIYRLIRRGEVRLNRKRCKPDSRINEGDQVRIPPVRMAEPGTPPKPGQSLTKLLLDSVIVEDELFMAINKPAGIPVHGGSGVRLGLIEALRQLKPHWQELELAHRLDRDTSGCMIIAKNPQFLKFMHQQLQQKTVNKTYLALVHGYWPDSLVEVDAPLQKNMLQSGERMVKVDQDGKPSLTRFTVVEHFGRIATLVKAMPVTGRTHQIRVHCQSAGHAIVGDSKYSSPSPSAALSGVKGLCLHAAKLEFLLNLDEPSTVIQAPLGEFFTEQLNALRSK